MLVTDVFSCCYEIKDFFQSPMFSWCAGVQELGGSIARQIVKLANRNIPYHRSHAQFINGGRPRGRNPSALLFSVGLNPLLFGNLNFSGSLVFFVNFMKFAISGFCNCCSVVGLWETVLYIVCFAYWLLLLSLLLVVLLVVLVFALLSY